MNAEPEMGLNISVFMQNRISVNKDLINIHYLSAKRIYQQKFKAFNRFKRNVEKPVSVGLLYGIS